MIVFILLTIFVVCVWVALVADIDGDEKYFEQMEKELHLRRLERKNGKP